MRALSLLLLTAVASAQDELYETTWVVSEEGDILVWPDPELGDLMEQSFKPTPMFEGGLFDESWQIALALFLAPGPSDLASLCDSERHLRKLRQIAFDEDVVSYLNPYEEFIQADESDPLARRRHLDRLLRIHVAGRRGLKDAVDRLEGVAKSEKVEPITRLAARDTAAALRGEKLPAVDLPPLDGIPADADILVLIEARKIPAWRDVWRLVRTGWVREVRGLIAQLGSAWTPSDSCYAQRYMDRESERFYELARRFGNARIHRTLIALRLHEDSDDLLAAKALLRCDGVFEVDRFREGLTALGLKPAGQDKRVAVQLADVDVTATPTRLVASRGFPMPAEGGGVAADLAKLGLGGGDAIWVHCRRVVPFADRLPVAGIESLTLRVGFEGGITVRAEVRFRDEDSARKAAGELEKWKAPDLKPVDLREPDLEAIGRVKALLASLTVSVEGTTLVAQWSAPGETPESLLAGVIGLQALYEGD